MISTARLLDRRGASAVAALAAGAGPALAFPPFGFLPGLVGYGLLLVLFDTADPARPLRSAFWRGWLAGSVFFLISTWWISEAFFVDPEAHAWQAPFAIGLLAGGLGLFWGLTGVLYRLPRPGGALRVLVFAGAFCLLEWLRGHVLTGFPWDLAGESWRAGSAISQGAALIGAYGMSWITVAASATPALLLDDGGGRRIGFGAVTAGALALASLYGYGAARLDHGPPTTTRAPVVRIVQPDIDEQADYTSERLRTIVQTYVDLTARSAARAPDIVVWPEGAIPAALDDYLAPTAWTRAAIAAALKPGQTLLVGGYRVAGSPDAPVYYNSLMALRDQGGDLVKTAVYDKYRLVPFGEYLPAAGLLKPLGIDKLVNVGDGFSTGPAPRPIAPVGVPRVQPLICYESLFPGFTRQGARFGRAAWIVNVSDDAWFGRTYGPLQHLNLASYRAIEEGLPIVRATPTGVSAVIDAYGRIAPGQRLDHGARGTIDAVLPPALVPTPYARVGSLAFWSLLALSAIAAMIGRITPRKQKE